MTWFVGVGRIVGNTEAHIRHKQAWSLPSSASNPVEMNELTANEEVGEVKHSYDKA